ncbi:MAG: hypothetical protein Q4A82_06650 [Corynebacterium sp.]|nr:hypothetical protein [Corynebacterium sp.]
MKPQLTPVALIILGLVLSACTPRSVQEKLPAAMGNATPAASPATSGTPAGDVFTLPEPFTNIAELDRVGDTLAVRTGTHIAVGTLAQLRSGDFSTVDVDVSCGDISTAPSHSEFILGCADGVHAISTAGTPANSLIQATEQPITAAVKTTDGMIIAGSNEREEALLFTNGDGGEGKPKTIRVEDPTDAMIAVPTNNGPDVVYRINRHTTIIQTIDVGKKSSGAVLRVGLGVGMVAPAAQGMAITSDAVGKQFGVYMTLDAIRLHQTTPTTSTPWAVAWDDKHQQVWVTTTDDNKIRRYQIGSGQGEELEAYNSIANAQSVLALPDGTIVASSASGAGLQILQP